MKGHRDAVFLIAAFCLYAFRPKSGIKISKLFSDITYSRVAKPNVITIPAIKFFERSKR
jgi:hypothetical protein